MKISLAIIFILSLYLLTINADEAKSSSSSSSSSTLKPTAVGLIEVKENSSCEVSLDQTAALIEPVLLVSNDKWPTTLEAINAHCELGNKVYKGMRRYGKCISGITRQALYIFLRGVKKFIQSICVSNKKKQDAAEVLKCASNETNKGWVKCLNRANKQLDVMSRNASDPAMVGNICCTYSAMVQCVAQNTGTSPECPGNRDTSKFLQSAILLVLKDLTDLLCTNYETKESCEIHNAGRADVLQAISDETGYKIDGAFLLTPLIRAAGQLGEIHADDV